MLDFVNQCGQVTITEGIVRSSVSLYKNAFLLGRPEEWNCGVLLLMLHFEKWVRKFEHREGKGGSPSSQGAKTFFPQHLVCFVSLLTWEEEVELISV